jgi:hypothetical protein
MALPKKLKKDLNVKIVDPQGGPQNWVDQFKEQNKGYLPRSVDHADLDKGFIEFIENDIPLVTGGKKVPVQFMSTQRWAEFAKGWKNSDKYGNLKIPFISIVRKPDAQTGTNPADFKIPIRKTFEYMRVPTWDGNKKGMDIYKIPNPVGVDLTFTVRFFTYKMRQLNQFNKLILQTFASAQAYVNIKGHYFPIMLENIGDESTVENIDAKRYYVQTYEMKLQGYLVDENEFEVTPALERAIVSVEIDEKKPKAISRFIKDDTSNDKVIKCIIQFLPGSPTSIRFNAESNTTFSTIETENITDYTIRVNGNIVTLPFAVLTDDLIVIDVVKTNSSELSELTLRGLIEV